MLLVVGTVENIKCAMCVVMLVCNYFKKKPRGTMKIPFFNVLQM